MSVNASTADPRLAGRDAAPDRLRRADRSRARVRELGAEITAAYPDGDLLVLGLLKGSFIFLSDLVREITRPLQVDFLVASSYGDATVSSGNVRLVYDPETELEGKHILLVEDIVDTGRTLNRLMDLLQARNPRSLEICALLHKHIADELQVRHEVRRVRRTERVPGRVRVGSRRELPAPSVHRELAVMPVPMPPKNGHKNDGFNWGRFSKTLSFWILILLIPVALIQLSGARVRAGAARSRYTAVQAAARRGTTSRKVTIQAGKNVTGDVQARRCTIDGHDGEEVHRAAAGRELAGRGRPAATHKGVQIDAKDAEADPSRRGSSTSCRGCCSSASTCSCSGRCRRAAAKAFSFGKSKAKLLTGDTPKVTFADVAGADEAKQELQEIIEFLRDPQKFTKLGGRLPKGCAARRSAGNGQDAARAGRRR